MNSGDVDEARRASSAEPTTSAIANERAKPSAVSRSTLAAQRSKSISRPPGTAGRRGR